jgi:F-type H+-transporting ATPase subunit delta
MRGASTRAAAAVVEQVEEAIGSGADATRLGEELFALCVVLDAQPTLRRVLTDPTVEADRKTELAKGLLSDFDDATVAVVGGSVRLRWSLARNLSDALEQGGIAAFLAAAEAEGDLDELDDELFRFARIVEGNPQLREAFNDRTAPVSARQRLVDTLIGERVGAPALHLVRQAVGGRHRSVVTALAEMQRLAAARRQRLVAVVRVARPLKAKMHRRLVKALTARFGHELQLNVIIDPDVQGGVRVTVGNEVVDGTVSTKLAEARRRLAG